MERSAAIAEKASKADSSKNASRLSPARVFTKGHIDPLNNLVQRGGLGGRDPSIESMAIQLASLPTDQRWEAAMSLQRTMGNQFMQRMAVQMKTTAEEGGHEAQLQGQIGPDALTSDPVQPKTEPNRTGLPDRLKAGIERLSGLSLADVRVYRNSPKPEELQALAYTQGNRIYVAPGKEDSLPHEAWHVVQQKQDRVRPRFQMKEAQINDDWGLEEEASMMGAKAMAGPKAPLQSEPSPQLKGEVGRGHGVQRAPMQAKGASLLASAALLVVQRLKLVDLIEPTENPLVKAVVAGEMHDTIPKDEERANLGKLGLRVIYEPDPIPESTSGIRLDNPFLRMEDLITELNNIIPNFFDLLDLNGVDPDTAANSKGIAENLLQTIRRYIVSMRYDADNISDKLIEALFAPSASLLWPVGAQDSAINKEFFYGLLQDFYPISTELCLTFPLSTDTFLSLKESDKLEIKDRTYSLLHNLESWMEVVHKLYAKKIIPYPIHDAIEMRSRMMLKDVNYAAK